MNLDVLRLRVLFVLGLTLPGCHGPEPGTAVEEKAKDEKKNDDDKKSEDEAVIPLPGPPCPPPVNYDPTKPHWGPSCQAHMSGCQPAVAATPAKHYPAPYDRCAPQAGGGGVYSHFSREATDQARMKDPSACCYVQVVMHPMGRPLRDSGEVILPALSPCVWGGWSEARIDAPLIVAQRYRAMAVVEASSIAAFDALHADMVRCNAPAELLRDTLHARDDEIVHAASALTIAERIDGMQVEVAALPARAPVTIATLVREAVLDGCFGESVGAIEASECANACTIPEIAAHHARVAEDEARHAELAFRWVAWLVQRHTGEAIPALRRALADLSESVADGRPVDEALESFGLLGARRRSEIARRVRVEVVVTTLSCWLSMHEAARAA